MHIDELISRLEGLREEDLSYQHVCVALRKENGTVGVFRITGTSTYCGVVSIDTEYCDFS